MKSKQKVKIEVEDSEEEVSEALLALIRLQEELDKKLSELSQRVLLVSAGE